MKKLNERDGCFVRVMIAIFIVIFDFLIIVIKESGQNRAV